MKPRSSSGRMMNTQNETYSYTGEAGRFRDEPMDVESSSSESGEGRTTIDEGSPTPEPYPIEEVTTILTCGNCDHDVIISGKILSEGILLVPESPVPHILGTNAVPSFHEEPAVHGYIHQTSQAIGQLDWEIRRLHAIMQTLLLEREKLYSLVEEHKALLSPVRRVPSDLLGEIFGRCQRGATCEVIPDVPDSFDKNSGPLLLTHVCQRWREQALRMPELWTDIRIRVGRGELQESRRLPLIHAWLERSSNHPLTVCMTERQLRSPVYNSDSRNVAVGMLIGAARRWEKLYLALHSLTVHWPLFQGLGGHIPNLHHCTIVAPPGDVVTDTGVMPPHEALTNLLSNAPLLRSLSLDYNISILGLNYPRQSMTHLDLYTITKERCIPVAMALDTLSQCPTLTSFKVRCHVPEPISTSMHLYQPSLTKLEIQIEADSGPGPESLLQHLTLPHLSDLAIYVPELEWDQDTFLSFLERTGPLKSFGIRCKKLEKKPLLQILGRMPQLTSLAMDVGLNITDDLLNDLSVIQDQSRQILLPKLTRIELGGHLFIKDSEFLSLISSRRYPLPGTQTATLEEVSIVCDGLVYGFVGPYLVEQLDELRWWGLRVRIVRGNTVEYPTA